MITNIVLIIILILITGAVFDPWPGLSKKQREWVLERDDHKCQFPVWDEKREEFRICGNTHKLEVHHIFPKRAYKFWTLFRKDPHRPNRLITLCKKHHNEPHSDMKTMKGDWKELEKKRNKKIRNGKPYWGTNWDVLLIEIAETRTLNYELVKMYPETKQKKEDKKDLF